MEAERDEATEGARAETIGSNETPVGELPQNDLVDRDQPGIPLEPAKRKKLWETLGGDAERLEFAANMAADMEMGYYVDRQNVVWPPKPKFVWAEIMRHMEYGVAYQSSDRRPAWFPERGMKAFADFVRFKVDERQLLARPSFETVKPFLEAVYGRAVMEQARRLWVAPETFTNRDLTELITKTAKVFASGGAQAPMQPGSNMPLGDAATTIFAEMTAVFARSLPEGVARDNGLALFQKSVKELTLKLTTGVASVAEPANAGR